VTAHATERVQAACLGLGAGICTLASITDLGELAVFVRHTGTYDRRLDAGEFVADQISTAVTVLLALDLLAADLLVCWAAKEALRTGADRLVAEGRADGVAATNDRTVAGVLTLKQAVVAAHTRVLLPALNIRPTPGLLDTEAVLAGVE
jgi:hypothetical protein